MTVEQLDSKSNCFIEQLRILLRTRRSEYDINGFTHEEITELISEIACPLIMQLLITCIFNVTFLYINVYNCISFVYDNNKIYK